MSRKFRVGCPIRRIVPLGETRRGRERDEGGGGERNRGKSTRRIPQRNDGRLMHEGVGGINATLRVEQNYRLRRGDPRNLHIHAPHRIIQRSRARVCAGDL